MPKYYVESGNLKQVIDAEDPFDACVKSVKTEIQNMVWKNNHKKELRLSKLFISSESGFPSERNPYIIDTHNDSYLSTKYILKALNHDQ